MTKYVSTRPVSGTKDSAGIGYVIIPRGVDKKKFIEQCFRTGTISLLLENGGVIDDVLITKSVINQIDFPESFNKKGSLLVWVNQPKKQRPIVIGSLSNANEFVNFSKNKSALRRATANFVSEVLVDAQNGSVIITSNSSVEGGGDIYIISTNKNKKSKLNIEVSGSINIKSPDFILTNSNKLSLIIKDKSIDEEITEITYEKGIGFSYSDEFGNKMTSDSDGINISPQSKFTIGFGDEPAMLSQTFRDIFEDLTDMISKLATTCSKIQVGTAMGTSTVPTNVLDLKQIAQDIADLKSKYPDFQSQINFTE